VRCLKIGGRFYIGGKGLRAQDRGRGCCTRDKGHSSTGLCRQRITVPGNALSRNILGLDIGVGGYKHNSVRGVLRLSPRDVDSRDDGRGLRAPTRNHRKEGVEVVRASETMKSSKEITDTPIHGRGIKGSLKEGLQGDPDARGMLITCNLYHPYSLMVLKSVPSRVKDGYDLSEASDGLDERRRPDIETALKDRDILELYTGIDHPLAELTKLLVAFWLARRPAFACGRVQEQILRAVVFVSHIHSLQWPVAKLTPVLGINPRIRLTPKHPYTWKVRESVENLREGDLPVVALIRHAIADPNSMAESKRPQVKGHIGSEEQGSSHRSNVAELDLSQTVLLVHVLGGGLHSNAMAGAVATELASYVDSVVVRTDNEWLWLAT
jgi:hypothetical protein